MCIRDQIQYRILARSIVTRRRVDVDLALTAEGARMIHIASYCAVRNVARVIVRRALAMYHQLTVRRLVGKSGERIIRIGRADAVDDELVHIDVRLDRSNSCLLYTSDA